LAKSFLAALLVQYSVALVVVVCTECIVGCG